MKTIILMFVFTFSLQVRSVTIDYLKVQNYIKQSCTDNNISFKKSIWESDLAESGDYSSLLTFDNECISQSDKLYLEFYYQYKNEKIILDDKATLLFKELIKEERVEEDLLNLVSWLHPKIINFKEDRELIELWEVSYKIRMEDIQKLMSPKFPSAKEISDIYHYGGGKPEAYNNKLRLFLFCRRERNHHCLLIGKDKDNNPIELSSDIWSHPALAKSSRGLPSNVVNGQTPQGIHTIDSVMPEANRQLAFGKYRRLILNWVRGDFEDREEESFLPSSSFDSLWWRQASLSKKVGRKDLRIHGTGRINDDPTSTHFPFRKSAGCITQREGRYGDTNYVDQRLLLDKLMDSLGLEISYSNEEKIKGVLYVIEIDDQKAHVSLDEIKAIVNE